MDIQRMKQRRNVVILGGGFGGIACALRLERRFRKKPSLFRDFNIVLVDKHDYHLYTPTLYDVSATATDDASAINIKKAVSTPITEILEGKRITFIQGAILKVNVAEKKITFDDETALTYEYLVFALGSEMAYFGIPGLKEHSISLKRLDDAIHIRAAIRRKYEAKGPTEKLTIIVGGGGPTGVELSAELQGYIRELNRLRNEQMRVETTIVEGAPTVLPGFDPWTVGNAKKRLAKLGVRLKEGSLISRADGEAVWVKASPDAKEEEKLPYDVFIWSGGVQAVNVMSNGGLSTEKRGRFETDPYLLCISPDKHLDIAKNIFAIGDNACFINPETHRPVPTTARLAIEQGKIAAENIFRDIHGKPRRPFKLWKYPYVIPLGGKYAVAEIGPFKLKGLLGWLFHELVEFYYFSTITHDKWTAWKRWWRGFEILSKND